MTTIALDAVGSAELAAGGLALPSLGFIQNIGTPGFIVILVIALLIFGKRLPDVARSLGRSIMEFKKGVKSVEQEIESEAGRPARSPQQLAENATREALDREELRNPYRSGGASGEA